MPSSLAPPLTLPVEVLERILIYLFSPSPLNPFTLGHQLTPPSDLRHLLLVSRGFSTLVLPSFLRVISIQHSSTWRLLFDVNLGYFSEMDKGATRRELVEEVRLSTEYDALVPYNFRGLRELAERGLDPLDPQHQDSVQWVLPFDWQTVDFPNLKRVVLLPPSSSRIQRSSPESDLYQLVESIRPRTRLSKLKAVVRGDRVKAVKSRMVTMDVERRAYYALLPWTTSGSIHLPHSFLRGNFTDRSGLPTILAFVLLRDPVATFHIHASPSKDRRQPPRAEVFVEFLRMVTGRFGKARRYVMVGFQTEYRRVVGWGSEVKELSECWEWELASGERVGMYDTRAREEA